MSLPYLHDAIVTNAIQSKTNKSIVKIYLDTTRVTHTKNIYVSGVINFKIDSFSGDLPAAGDEWLSCVETSNPNTFKIKTIKQLKVRCMFQKHCKLSTEQNGFE